MNKKRVFGCRENQLELTRGLYDVNGAATISDSSWPVSVLLKDVRDICDHLSNLCLQLLVPPGVYVLRSIAFAECLTFLLIYAALAAEFVEDAGYDHPKQLEPLVRR
jgi:hypothetical protein